jgi:hypothetical protein
VFRGLAAEPRRRPVLTVRFHATVADRLSRLSDLYRARKQHDQQVEQYPDMGRNRDFCRAWVFRLRWVGE